MNASKYRIGGKVWPIYCCHGRKPVLDSLRTIKTIRGHETADLCLVEYQMVGSGWWWDEASLYSTRAAARAAIKESEDKS